MQWGERESGPDCIQAYHLVSTPLEDRFIDGEVDRNVCYNLHVEATRTQKKTEFGYFLQRYFHIAHTLIYIHRQLALENIIYDYWQLALENIIYDYRQLALENIIYRQLALENIIYDYRQLALENYY